MKENTMVWGALLLCCFSVPYLLHHVWLSSTRVVITPLSQWRSSLLPPPPSPELAAIMCDIQDKAGYKSTECNGTWKYTENGLAVPIDTPLPYIPPPEN
jgi:hypothetical protein